MGADLVLRERNKKKSVTFTTRNCARLVLYSVPNAKILPLHMKCDVQI
jgi:hypothetical protein